MPALATQLSTSSAVSTTSTLTVRHTPAPKLRILLIGAGGREHALAWRLEQSPNVDQIFVAPGNGGTALGEKYGNVNINADDFEGLAAFAAGSHINLVIPGPEAPLVEGIEMVFRRIGIPVFGPTKEAARMEGSKTYSKDFMHRHGIPTAAYGNFSNVDAAKAYVQQAGHRVVIKATGLAAGKGVLLPETTEEALAGLDQIMVQRAFGEAGDEVVVEEYLVGQELSILAFCDGYTILPLPGAQDHKQIGDGDTGPNTGGMGAYSPAPIATPALNDEIMRTVLKPTLEGMRKDGSPFVGLLFVGLMITATGPKVLEYNVRFGDPETQTLLPLLSPSTDLSEIIMACVERRLDCVKLVMRPESSVTVVLAAGGYPDKYEKGKTISIKALPRGVTVFHAGTSLKNDQLETSGGRVLGVNAVAATLEEAAALAYKAIQALHFDGMVFRRDIAHRALRTPTQQGSSTRQALTYADAGVSIDAGNQLVTNIKPFVKATRRPGADGEIGGFGGTFDLKAAGYRDPVLVSGTDGVGTKLRVAQAVGKHDTVGIDLVAMCVNDLVVQGAEPLYFLDYFGCGKLEVDTATQVVKGIADGCKKSGCALIGGETAEMPSMYEGDDYDLAGFAVGAVEREHLLPGPDVKAGDVIIGLASSGVHSNGFSLVRRILADAGVSFTSPCPWQPTLTIGHALLEPTVLYVRQLLSILRSSPGAIKALSHITGGGFLENIPRVLPAGCGASIDATSYTLPPIFAWLMQAGNIAPLEMARTFNCGVGMVAVVSPSQAAAVEKALNDFEGGVRAFRIGEVIEGKEVKMQHLEAWTQAASSLRLPI